jgi:hypothetical protein
MTALAPTPGQAVYGAQHAALRRRFPGIAEIRWDELGAEARVEWEVIARAGIGAYIEANGRDPVDARSVILEAVGLPAGIAGRLGAAETKLAEVRELAAQWARLAPADRSLADEFRMSPGRAVSSDCGRELLALLGGSAGLPAVPAAAGETTPEGGT